MKLAIALVASVFLVSVFQNCGLPFHAGESDDLASFSEPDSNVASADLGWSTKASVPSVDSLSRVSRWMDVTAQGVALYPPLKNSGVGTDLTYSGVATTVSGQPYIAFGAGQVLTPSTSDTSGFTSDQYSILFIVRDVQVPVSSAIRFFSLEPIGGDATGSVRLEANADASGNVILYAFHYFDGSNYASRKISLSAADLAGVLAMSVRVGTAATDIQLSVNGKVSTNPVQVFGSPADLGYASRIFTIHTPSGGYGSGGSMSLGEFGLYRRSLDDNTLAQASSQLYNHWSRTFSTGTPTPVPATPGPTTALTGTQLYTKYCSSCHGDIATSAKRGITLDRLMNGISNPSNGMSNLSSVSPADLQKIVDALK